MYFEAGFALVALRTCYGDSWFEGKSCGNPVGKLWEILGEPLVYQGVPPEEGSEPGALLGHDAVCHGRGRWGSVLGQG